MKLDVYQRTVLINQFEILKRLDPKGEWDNAITVFRNGYESEYRDYMVDGREILSEEAADEVIQILQMFRTLDQAKSKAKFEGFDGNDGIESGYMGYVSHLWKSRKFT